MHSISPSLSGVPGGAYALYQAWVEHAKLWRLAVGRSRRYFEPIAVVGQFRRVMKTEFGGVAQAGKLIGRQFAVGDKELSGAELGGFLAGAVGHQHDEAGRLIVKYLDQQRGSRFRPGVDFKIFREVTPYDFACFRSWPPMGAHASEQARLDRPRAALGHRFANRRQLSRRKFAVVGLVGWQHFFCQLAQRIVNHLRFSRKAEVFGQFFYR